MGEQKLKQAGVLITYLSMPYLIESLDRKFTTYKLYESHDREAFLTQHSQSIRGVVCGRKDGINAHMIDALPCLEIVATSSVGFDKVDLAKCRQRNIAVVYTPDVLTDDVADLTIALMLDALRQISASDRYVRQGLWQSKGDYKLTCKLSGKRVGIVGLGRIGSAIAKRAQAFGCSIAYYSRSKKPDVPFMYHSNVIDLAASSDVLVVACSLTKDTHHIVNKSVLDALGTKGTLVNVGRGALVDEKELVKALVEGRIQGAGLDVFENEPHVPQELYNLENVVMVPHMGCATWETTKAMADLIVGNLEAHFSKKPLLTPVPL
ncbi:hydroxyphenylpyruvate reductase-like [Cryptomeria japonica]|uniref:hydroxyphenylpyruvate reductase-like n=1 Tax=Cryptomeria japonica TaxID=3369 RepID=UPI0027D9D331|nr:hydroxyphenylpyruvate reductase-like [Cryptomeria japonica]